MKSRIYSFERAYNELPIKDAQVVRDYIYTQIGMKSNTEFYLRKKSWKNIPVWCYDIINLAFYQVGYKKNVFDITDE